MYSCSILSPIGALVAVGLLLLPLACANPIRPFRADGDDWLEQGNADWSFDGNTITGTANEQEGYLVTRDRYDRFTLTLEFFSDSTLNSGVFASCDSLRMHPEVCNEVNIWDLHPNQAFRTGSIVAKVVPAATIHTIGRWCTFRLESQPGRFQVYLNDTLTAELPNYTPTAGHLGLQASGTGAVRFRDIRLVRGK